MPFLFPAAPNSGDNYSYGDITWEYNGYAWEKIDAGITTPHLEVDGITGSIQFNNGFGGLSGSSDFYWDGTDLILTDTHHLIGDILGAVEHQCHNVSGVGITKGYPVYITGTDGASTILRIALADASNPSKMPAIGLATNTIADGEYGNIVVIGTILQLDTSLYSTNQTLYVSPGGGLTGIRPIEPSHLVQNIGKVGRSHPNTGSLIVLGPGRTNDIPNIIDGGIY